MCIFAEIMQRLVAQRDIYDVTTNLPSSSNNFEADLPREFVKRSLFFKKLLYEKHVNDIMKDLDADKQFT